MLSRGVTGSAKQRASTQSRNRAKKLTPAMMPGKPQGHFNAGGSDLIGIQQQIIFEIAALKGHFLVQIHA